MCADDFYSATVSAAFGGTTTVMPFAGNIAAIRLQTTVDSYREAARPKAVDRLRPSHMIISDPTETVLQTELPV